MKCTESKVRLSMSVVLRYNWGHQELTWAINPINLLREDLQVGAGKSDILVILFGSGKINKESVAGSYLMRKLQKMILDCSETFSPLKTIPADCRACKTSSKLW